MSKSTMVRIGSNQADLATWDGTRWDGVPPSWNPGLENNDLIRWGKDNTSDWTTFQREGGGGDSHTGDFFLRVTQSADRRTMSSIDAQAGGTVEGQAVIYGTSSLMGWFGLPVLVGETLTWSAWVRARTGASVGDRCWLVSFQDGSLLSDAPVVLTTSYQEITLTYPASQVEQDSGASLYIFFGGVEAHGYFIDDVTLTRAAP